MKLTVTYMGPTKSLVELNVTLEKQEDPQKLKNLEDNLKQCLGYYVPRLNPPLRTAEADDATGLLADSVIEDYLNRYKADERRLFPLTLLKDEEFPSLGGILSVDNLIELIELIASEEKITLVKVILGRVDKLDKWEEIPEDDLDDFKETAPQRTDNPPQIEAKEAKDQTREAGFLAACKTGDLSVSEQLSKLFLTEKLLFEALHAAVTNGHPKLADIILTKIKDKIKKLSLSAVFKNASMDTHPATLYYLFSNCTLQISLIDLNAVTVAALNSEFTHPMIFTLLLANGANFVSCLREAQKPIPLKKQSKGLGSFFKPSDKLPELNPRIQFVVSLVKELKNTDELKTINQLIARWQKNIPQQNTKKDATAAYEYLAQMRAQDLAWYIDLFKLVLLKPILHCLKSPELNSAVAANYRALVTKVVSAMETELRKGGSYYAGDLLKTLDASMPKPSAVAVSVSSVVASVPTP